MAKLSERISVELEQIDKTLAEIDKARNFQEKEMVILAGMGFFLQDFYNGIENIFKQILKNKNIIISQSPSWHKDLLEKAITENIISTTCGEKLNSYLAFRHFAIHAYGIMLDENEMMPLLNNINDVYLEFKSDIAQFLE